MGAVESGGVDVAFEVGGEEEGLVVDFGECGGAGVDVVAAVGEEGVVEGIEDGVLDNDFDVAVSRPCDAVISVGKGAGIRDIHEVQRGIHILRISSIDSMAASWYFEDSVPAVRLPRPRQTTRVISMSFRGRMLCSRKRDSASKQVEFFQREAYVS